MKRCAFLSLDDPSDFVIDDELAIAALQSRGWSVETIPWTADAAWSAYDVVVIRSTWDYQHDAARFLGVLAAITAAGVRLENGLPVVRWNARKTYLRELESRGSRIVPTIWCDTLGEEAFEALFTELAADELVVKPQVGANAGDTVRVQRGDGAARRHAAALFARRPCMVQPFLRSVVEEGEYSLILFDGELSHAILKTPRTGDFRVQEEHGGIIRPVTPPPGLVAAATQALHGFTTAPLYARADFVRLDADSFGIMELELIEPSLYFRMDAGSPDRFAAALERRVRAVEAA